MAKCKNCDEKIGFGKQLCTTCGEAKAETRKKLEAEESEIRSKRDQEWAKQRRFAGIEQQFDEFKNRYTLFSPVIKGHRFTNAAGTSLGGTMEVYACTAFNKDGSNLLEYVQFTRGGEGWSNWLHDHTTNWLFDGEALSGTATKSTEIGYGGYVTETIFGLLPPESVDRLLQSTVAKVQIGGFATSLLPTLKDQIALIREKRDILIAGDSA